MPDHAPTLQLTFPEPDVAVLTLDTPGKSANILSTPVLDELAGILETLETRQDLAGVVIISGKPGTFIAGADLREFARSLDIPPETTVAMCRRGQSLFARLQQLPGVSVAAVDGICVGGGAELACWCDRRVLSDREATHLGFPEVKLGLFPGWGGTVRAPRLVGLANAVELITTGDSVHPARALQMGLADDVVSADDLLAAAIRMIRGERQSGDYLRDRRRWSAPLEINETELGFLAATASAAIRQQTKGQYPAPEAALEVMLEAAGLDQEAALVREAEGMARLFGSPVNAALLNVFFLTDRIKRDRGIDAPLESEPRPVQSMGVIGSGIMGSGIAAANLKRRVPVAIMDASDEALRRGLGQVLEEAAYDRERRGPTVSRMERLAPLLRGCRTTAELAECDVVIEAIVENAEAKRGLYASLESQLRPDAILASNTSTIPITKLAAGLQSPQRFCGIHFFNPVRRMQLVEVIRGEATSDETVARAVAYAKQIGKMPIVVRDGPGFLVNRLLFPYMNESLQLLCSGVEVEAIESAAKRFGMPMGPITLYDVVGLDTALYAGRTMWEAFPDRITASPLLPALVKSGRLGQKSGAGFFRYGGRDKRGAHDPELNEFVKPYIKAPPAGTPELTRAAITDRLFLPMLLEATRVLAEQLVRDVRDVDLGMIFGLGFPAFRGGLLCWADSLGAAEIVERLKPLEVLGERFKPTPLLLEMADQGRRFYDS